MTDQIDEKTIEQNFEQDEDFVLDIRGLKVYFELRKRGFQHAGFVHAVDNVDLRLRRGETIAIVGESGCGKTSLMKTILRLNTPTGGEIEFDGEIINDLKSDAQECASQDWLCATGSLWSLGTIHECPYYS